MYRNTIKGFSLIELITVIIIAGIIAAIAIPKFFDLSGNAESAKLQTIANSFATGVSLVHSSWLSEGGDSSVNTVTSESGQTIGVSDEGWPENTQDTGGDGGFTVTECVNLFSGLIKNPPSIAATPNISKEFTASVGEDFITCTFTMNNTSGRSFSYDLSNGAISVTIP